MPKDYVGVKGPQFSFSRLASADPVLGVGMSLRSEKSVIFSIGVYTDNSKCCHWFNVYIDSGIPSMVPPEPMTSICKCLLEPSLYQEHGIPCKFLEAFLSQEEAKGTECQMISD
ncbi:hypothetical protein PSHT_00358 [Puccinia striiformis]|uniref:Uncharacterized protein n=1 Tax=Puccinia striiformis TaxID=27350 RepID=A0A2S4WN32_9BASI|nr:hypothetical protein PSHT_00358 [Puccinia striiformis]